MATEETFNPAAFARSESLTNINGGPVKSASISAPKQKTTTNYPRIDLEPIYSDLKDAIGHQWDVYFDAVARFIRGDLHAREFGDLTDEFLYASDHNLHLHNKFITAILFNVSRDGPDPGVAAWVTAASDKATGSAANKAAIASDASEQRLKKEVMAMSARDRRRLKTSSTTTDADDSATKAKTQYEEAYAASRIRAPEAPAAQAGSLTKTNVELEIKKRYQLPLFVESAEFPDAANVYNRIVPICYEESIPQGSTMQCAELAVTAAEFYLKDFLGTVFDRVRANGPRYDYGYAGGIFTSKFKKQVAREAELEQAKRLARNKDDGLLPIESSVARDRRPLTVADFQLADRTGPKLWNGYPLIAFELANRATENDFEEWRTEREEPGQEKMEDEMTVDGRDDDYDWDEDGFGGRGELAGLIDDCLVMT